MLDGPFVGALACLLLSACGGGGGGGADGMSASGAAIVTPVCVPAALPVEVHAYGDSTMTGIVVRPDRSYYLAARGPVAALQALFDARFGAGVALVVQESFGGATTRGQLALGAGPLRGISIENFGVNDSLLLSVAEFKANLRALDADVYQTPIPTDAAHWYGKPVSYEQFVQAVRDVAAEKAKPVVDMHAFIAAIPDWQWLTSDGLHPGEELYGRMALPMYEVLAPLVAKALCRSAP